MAWANKSVHLGVALLLMCFCFGMLQQGERLQTRLSYGGPRQVNGSSSNKQNRTGKDSEPLFVLHVGPPKTGTTTIQHFASNVQDLLQMDNFYYVGTAKSANTKNFHELVRYCRDGMELDCRDQWDEFKNVVQNHLEQKHNVLMSEEMLNVCRSPEEEETHLWERLMPILQGWRVRIVFTYRHLYDWVPSKYSQANNFHVTERRRYKVQNWPDNGGRIIASFTDFFDAFIKRTFHLPLPIKRRWTERISDIRVFNMENSTDILRDFFCRMIPESEQLCNYLGSPDVDVDLLNPSSNRLLHFDMLAVEAYQRGWFNNSWSRADVSNAAEIHAPTIGYSQISDFPLICLSQNKTETLFQDSLEYAKDMFPDRYSTIGGEQELRTKFDERVGMGKFCSVDVKMTLQQPKWRKFFKSLSRRDIRAGNSP